MKQQIKISLGDTVLEVLQDEADKLGIRLQAYIQLQLGKHALDIKETHVKVLQAQADELKKMKEALK